MAKRVPKCLCFEHSLQEQERVYIGSVGRDLESDEGAGRVATQLYACPNCGSVVTPALERKLEQA